MFTVSGKVLFNQKPAAYALVVFHPVKDTKLDMRPNGYTDKEGVFRLSTYSDGDGAPAGDYLVTVIWTGANPDTEEVAEAPDKLQGRYADPKTSGLKVTVKEGPNQLAPFELK